MPRQFKGFIFDVDATLVDTTKVINDIWKSWAAGHGLHFDAVAPHIHGRKIAETLARLGPRFESAVFEAEVAGIGMTSMKQAKAIAGALDFIKQLPLDRWAIATSGPRAIASTSLTAAGIPLPEVMICAEDVARGKPDPEPFALAARKLNLATHQCLAFEDSPAGVASAKAAGCFTIAILSSHRQEELLEADLIVSGFPALSLSRHTDGFSLRVPHIERQD